MPQFFDDMGRSVECAIAFVREIEQRELVEVADIEEQVCKIISLAVGDRECPSYTRELVMGHMAQWRLRIGDIWNETAVRHLKEHKGSVLLTIMEDDFRAIRDAKISTRFGEYSDDPDEVVKRRDRHDVPIREGGGMPNSMGFDGIDTSHDGILA